MINYLVIIAKQFMYCKKCQGLSCTIEGLKAEIKGIENIELFNAKQKQNLHSYIKRWSPVSTIAQNLKLNQAGI